jgi:hypothetical protein
LNAMFFIEIFTPPEAAAGVDAAGAAVEPESDESSEPQPPTARAPTAARARRSGLAVIGASFLVERVVKLRMTRRDARSAAVIPVTRERRLTSGAATGR